MEFSKNELTKKEKFILFLKKYGLYLALAVAAIVITVTVAVVASANRIVPPPDNGGEVVVPKVEWALPVNNIEILKGYSGKELQYNETYNRWEIHKAIDFKLGESDEVKNVFKGTVVSVTTNLSDGTVVIVEHEGGIKSIYKSLADNVKVSIGDKIEQGAVLGYGSTSSSRESKMGIHLHFAMQKDGKLVDPGNYLSLGTK